MLAVATMGSSTKALDVQVVLARHHDDETGDQTVLKVKAENTGDDVLTLVACALLPPAGLRIYSDPPHLAYPHLLAPGDSCYDWLDLHKVALLLQDMGCAGVVSLQAVFLSAGGPGRLARAEGLQTGGTDWYGVEHRSDPFAFDVARWRVT
jgi:hypothetical protein